MSTLEILGMGCRSCVGLQANVEQALRLEGRSDPVEKVSDYDRIFALDPSALPALAIDGKVVVAGRIATPAEIRQLLGAHADGAKVSATPTLPPNGSWL